MRFLSSLVLSLCLFLILISSPQANPNELTNGVINSAFMLLFKDSIRLFAAYNEGVINLLGNKLSLSHTHMHTHKHNHS